MRVFRIAVPTQQLDAARAFYEAVLGMPADDTVPSRLYFHCDGVIVALIDWTVEGRDDFHPTPDNVYFAVADLDTVYDTAETSGARIDAPIADRPWGERSFYCRDLDGNRLCFVDDTTLFLGYGAEWS